MSSLTEANRQHFNTLAGLYDTKPWFAVVNQKVTETLTSHLSWLDIPLPNISSPSSPPADKPIRLLDYACGPGIMTRIFAPHVTSTLGIDVAPNMVAEYNARAASANLSASAVEGNLFDKADPAPEMFEAVEWKGFDIAAVGFGFHHFEDVVHAARQLKERLRPGGVLVINDFLEGGDLRADEEGREIEGSEGNHAVHGHGHGHGHGHSHGHGHGHDRARGTGNGDGHSHSHGHSHGHGHHHAHHRSEEKDSHGHHHAHHRSGEKDSHGQGHHSHSHGHHTSSSNPQSQSHPQPSIDDNTAEFKERMNASIVVWHFTVEGVKKFFTEAGFVDVDVITMKERVYMEMSGLKFWRTILFAKGRRPREGEGERSEL